MYAIAIIGDILSAVPFVNIVSNFIAAVALGIAGSHTGVSIYSSERIGATLAVIVVETIPFVKIVPTWTIRVYFAKKDAQESEAESL